jgi:hypothetical protein
MTITTIQQPQMLSNRLNAWDLGKKASAHRIGGYMAYGHLLMSGAEVCILQTS